MLKKQKEEEWQQCQGCEEHYVFSCSLLSCVVSIGTGVIFFFYYTTRTTRGSLRTYALLVSIFLWCQNFFFFKTSWSLSLSWIARDEVSCSEESLVSCVILVETSVFFFFFCGGVSPLSCRRAKSRNAQSFHDFIAFYVFCLECFVRSMSTLYFLRW